jgi:Plasmid stabilization system protein
MKVLIRPQAWLDMERDMDYLKSKADDETAIRYYHAVRSAFRKLSRQPRVGRPRLELRPAGIRSWRVDPPFQDWLIFYQLTDEGLDIIRVKHGAMDIQSLFEN